MPYDDHLSMLLDNLHGQIRDLKADFVSFREEMRLDIREIRNYKKPQQSVISWQLWAPVITALTALVIALITGRAA